MEMLSLQQAIVEQGPAASPEQPEYSQLTSSELDSGEYWPVLDQSYSSISSFRNSSLDRWHRKSMLGGGAALKGNLQTLNQSISAQVSWILACRP